MSTYNQIRDANIDRNIVEYSEFDQDTLDVLNGDTVIDITTNAAILFKTKFYGVIFSYLTSFSNVFKLMNFLEVFHIFDDNFIEKLKLKIEKYFKKNKDYVDQCNLYGAIIDKIQTEIDLNIYKTLSTYINRSSISIIEDNVDEVITYIKKYSELIDKIMKAINK